MTARRRPVEANLDEVLPALRDLLRREHCVRKSAFTKVGIPRTSLANALERLRAEGFEETKTAIRVPVRAELATALNQRDVIPLAQLAKLIAGATGKECKAMAETFVREGTAKFAWRGKVQVIASQRTRTVSREELLALTETGKHAASALKKGHSLLHDDVREKLLGVVGAAKPALDVAAELARHVRPAVGLSFVPDAVRALAAHGIANVQAALLEAARAGRIELQPESGLNRLSKDDLELCPPGPHGTRLTWARLVGGKR